MSDELRRALDDLVQDVAAEQDARIRAGSGLPVAGMTARARRGRVRHGALVSAITACTVLGVAAGGLAAATWDRSVPPPAAPPTRTAAPTPTAPTPTPAPTTTGPTAPATALPTGDAALPFGACGSVVGSATSLPTAPGLTLDVTATPAVDRGGPIEIRTELAATAEGVAALAPGTGPSLVLARDGVVVATAATYPAGATVTEAHLVDRADPDRSTATFVSHVVPTVCDAPGATAGAPLPAGDYALLAISDVWSTGREALWSAIADGLPTVADVSSRTPLDHGAVVSTPVAVRVTAAVAGAGSIPVAPSGAPDLSGVGSVDDLVPYPDPCDQTTTPNASTGPLTVAGPQGAVTAGTDVSISTTYAGSGRVLLGRSNLVRVVRDGVLVAASAWTPSEEDIDFGTTLTDLVTTSGWTRCADGEQQDADASAMLPPGTYTAYPVVVARVYGLVGPDGAVIEPRRWEPDARQLVGEPFTLVVP